MAIVVSRHPRASGCEWRRCDSAFALKESSDGPEGRGCTSDGRQWRAGAAHLPHPLLCLEQIAGVPLLLWKRLDEISPDDIVVVARQPDPSATLAAGSHDEWQLGVLAGAFVAEGFVSELTSRYQINAQAFACDITDGAAVDRLVGEVTQTFGRLDVLINDAAYNVSIPFGDLDNLTLEVWDRIMAINLTGPMRLTKAVAPVMKAQGRGRIINIASVAGLSPTGSSIAYAVSKAGLIHLTRCMAVALAPETLVNCVAPGLLDGTRATANLRPEQIERSASGSLLKRPANKDDCADMVVAMCRTETMTGQTVVIDSGRIFH